MIFSDMKLFPRISLKTFDLLAEVSLGIGTSELTWSFLRAYEPHVSAACFPSLSLLTRMDRRNNRESSLE